jgi:hypothetical protein
MAWFFVAAIKQSFDAESKETSRNHNWVNFNGVSHTSHGRTINGY